MRTLEPDAAVFVRIQVRRQHKCAGEQDGDQHKAQPHPTLQTRRTVGQVVDSPKMRHDSGEPQAWQGQNRTRGSVPGEIWASFTDVRTPCPLTHFTKMGVLDGVAQPNNAGRTCPVLSGTSRPNASRTCVAGLTPKA